jgi:hypothetical protein
MRINLWGGGFPDCCKSDSIFAPVGGEAKPGTGYCRSRLEQHRQWLLDLVAAEPDLTLEEIGTRLRAVKKHKAGISSIWLRHLPLVQK